MNYKLTTSKPINNYLPDGEEMRADPAFYGAHIDTYVVENPAWNKALLDKSRHDKFCRYMETTIPCELVQEVENISVWGKNKVPLFIFKAYHF